MQTIIVEGVNKVGKTSFCNLLEQYGVYTVRDRASMLLSHESIHDYVMGAINAYLLVFSKFSCVVAFDRFHLTELVYGVLERAYYSEYVWDVDDRLAAMGSKLILMTDDIIKINERAERNMAFHQAAMVAAFRRSKMVKLEVNLAVNSQEAIRWALSK